MFVMMRSIVMCAIILLHVLSLVKAIDTLTELLNKADAAVKQGNNLDALKYFQEALQLNPKETYAIQGAASCLSDMGRFDEAGSYFEVAAESSGMFQFLLNAGMAYHSGGIFDKAIDAYARCLDANPQFRPCHVKIAGLYNHFGRFQDVQKHLLFAISLDPSDFGAYMHLGDVYNNLKQFSLAIETYKKALALNGPHKMQVLSSIGDAYTNLKEYTTASRYYNAIVNSKSKSIPADVLVSSLFNQLQTGMWKGFEYAFERTLRATRSALSAGSASPLSPYRALFLPLSPKQSLAISQSWARAFMQTAGLKVSSVLKASPHNGACSNATMKVIRVGYISRRFEDYPGTQMMLRLFELHNRTTITVHTYAHGADDRSKHRAHIAATSDAFMDISAMDTSSASALISKDQIDVLVDYDGMHDFNSVKVLLQRPAAIQASWLGFAGTTGFSPGEGVDYAFVDYIIAPPDIFGKAYSERMVFLPLGYQPQDEYQGAPEYFKSMSVEQEGSHIASQVTSPTFGLAQLYTNEEIRKRERYEILRQYSREHVNAVIHNSTSDGSPSHVAESVVTAVWFICFNRMEKITPDVFEDWMRILGRTSPVSTILVLMSQSIDIDQAVKMTALVYGITSDRLVFLNHMPKAVYLRALALSDVFLDTAHYGAHTTASDALYSATPVLTLPKHTVSSRVAASLNTMLGVEYLNANSRKDYVNVAVALGTRKVLLRAIRDQIGSNLGKVVYNSTLFAHKLDRTFAVLKELYPLYRNIYHMDIQI